MNQKTAKLLRKVGPLLKLTKKGVKDWWKSKNHLERGMTKPQLIRMVKR